MVIVRLGLQNRMVTKGYRKGVYEWVTYGTSMDSNGGGDPRRWRFSAKPLMVRGERVLITPAHLVLTADPADARQSLVR